MTQLTIHDDVNVLAGDAGAAALFGPQLIQEAEVAREVEQRGGRGTAHPPGPGRAVGMVATTAPAHPEYADDPIGDELIHVNSVQIGGTYWCGANYIGDHERWASWGVAGLSLRHPTRQAATAVQVREYCTNPALYDRLDANEASARTAAEILRAAEVKQAAERKRRQRCGNGDAPGQVLLSIPPYHAMYADPEEVRLVATWLNAHHVHFVSAVHEIRVEQRKTRRVIVYEHPLDGAARSLPCQTETRAVVLVVEPPTIATPARPDLHQLLDEHWPRVGFR